MPKRYPVKQAELKKGAKAEMKEHPTMSERTARRTARQHLQEHPLYYKVMPVAEQMMARQEKRIKPIRRSRPRPQPVVTFF